MKRPHDKLVAFIVLFLCLGLIVPSLVLGGKKITLKKGPEYAGLISQSLGPDNNGNLFEYGKGFTISDVKSFEGGWKAVKIQTQTEGSAGMVILHQINGTYKVVLGPGTSFEQTYTSSMPSGLALYLQNEGMLYESTK